MIHSKIFFHLELTSDIRVLTSRVNILARTFWRDILTVTYSSLSVTKEILAIQTQSWHFNGNGSKRIRRTLQM